MDETPNIVFYSISQDKNIGDLVKRLVHCDASNNFVHKPLMELHESLKTVLEDTKVVEYFSILEKILQWLDELRDNLRITRQNNLKDSKPSDFELDDILIKINEVLLRIRTESWKLDKQYQQIASTIIDAFESHWEELFIPDPIVKGRKFLLDVIITDWRVVIAE